LISLLAVPPLPAAVLTPPARALPARAPRQRPRQADPEIIDKHSLGLEPGKLPATPADCSLASVIFLDDSMFRSLSGRGQGLLATSFRFYASVVLRDPCIKGERGGSGAGACRCLCPPARPRRAGLGSPPSFAQTFLHGPASSSESSAPTGCHPVPGQGHRAML